MLKFYVTDKCNGHSQRVKIAQRLAVSDLSLPPNAVRSGFVIIIAVLGLGVCSGRHSAHRT